MVLKPRYTDHEKIIRYGNALDTAATHAEIAPMLAALGYDETRLNEGKTLHTAAVQLFDANVRESTETVTTRNLFSEQWDALKLTFLNHRKIAKVLYRNDNATFVLLRLSEAVSTGYYKWLNLVDHFYTTVAADAGIRATLAKLNLTEEKINAATTALAALKIARADYEREMAEDQPATDRKNKALNDLTDWMDEFFDVAKIALEDDPQLLELLGLLVR